MITRQTRKPYWLLLIGHVGLLGCFEFASLVHDEFSRVHVLQCTQVFVTPTAATERRRFISFSLRGGGAATNRERRLIERTR